MSCPPYLYPMVFGTLKLPSFCMPVHSASISSLPSPFVTTSSRNTLFTGKYMGHRLHIRWCPVHSTYRYNPASAPYPVLAASFSSSVQLQLCQNAYIFDRLIGDHICHNAHSFLYTCSTVPVWSNLSGTGMLSRTLSSPNSLHGQTLQADSQTTVGRHSVFEAVQIMLPCPLVSMPLSAIFSKSVS